KVIVFSYYNFRTSALFIQLFLAKVLTNLTLIVGAGLCARPLFPLMREMARHQINGPNVLWHSPGPRPTNDL
ncbi:hypothetical protein J4G08_17820, partial [Candidatus Poribacteria bacterium]|nr:hypothetical protein [Candidatus Poribacteria bacterium]